MIHDDCVFNRSRLFSAALVIFGLAVGFAAVMP